MNINVLTIKAQQSLQSAVTVAQQAGQQAVEPLHLLSVLIAEDENLGSFLLGKVGVNLPNLRKDVTMALSRLPKVSGGGEQYFSGDITKVVQRAVDFTKKFNDKYAYVEHLLLALVATLIGCIIGLASGHKGKGLGGFPSHKTGLVEVVRIVSSAEGFAAVIVGRIHIAA